MNWQIMLTGLVAGLLLLVEHWLPWRLMLGGRDLGRVWAYVLGVLALMVPLSVLFLTWGLVEAVCAVWAVVVSGGSAVVGAYGLDDWWNARAARREAVEREGGHGESWKAGQG